MPIPEMGVQATGLRDLARDIKAAGPAFNRLWRKRLANAGKIVADTAGPKASFSTRIPRSIKVSVTQKGVAVKAGGNKAPHAAIYETGGRHPVFGRPVWVPVEAKPYLMPALEQNLDKVADELAQTIEDYAREAGFR